jgi:hypothetical protein
MPSSTSHRSPGGKSRRDSDPDDQTTDIERQAFEDMYGINFDAITPRESQAPRREAVRRPPESSSHARPEYEQPPSNTGADSVPLSEYVEDADESAPRKSKKIGPGGIKMVIALLLIFLLVVSDIFTNGVLSWFGGAVKCRSPTSFGVVLQGIFLVIFYMIATHLVETKVL